MVFDDILEIKNGKNQKAVENLNGKYPIYGSGGVMGYADAYICEADTVIVGRKGSINNPIFVEEPFWNVDTAFGLQAKREVLLPRYLFYFCKFFDFERLNKAVTIPSLTKGDLLKIEIDLPELSKQQEIVNQLMKIEHIIELRKHELSELDNLIKARFVEMFGDPRSNPLGFEKSMLKDTCKVVTGNTPPRAVDDYYGDFIEWIKTDNIVLGVTNPTPASEGLSEEGMKVGRTVNENSILMACIAGSIASIGRVCITDRKVAFNQQINAVVPNKYNIYFLYILLQLSKDYLVEDINMALKGILSKSKLEEKEFIVPSMELQNQFADFVQQVDKSKVAVQKSLKEVQLLFDSLMQEYFG
jgi:type I restriction enzyme S subunit